MTVNVNESKEVKVDKVEKENVGFWGQLKSFLEAPLFGDEEVQEFRSRLIEQRKLKIQEEAKVKAEKEVKVEIQKETVPEVEEVDEGKLFLKDIDRYNEKYSAAFLTGSFSGYMTFWILTNYKAIEKKIPDKIHRNNYALLTSLFLGTTFGLLTYNSQNKFNENLFKKFKFTP